MYIHRYRAEVLISPEISDFSGPVFATLSTLFARALSFSFIISLRRLLSPPPLPPSPPRDPLYQTKQSWTRSDKNDDGPYVRLLGDNLYTSENHLYICSNLLTRYVFLAREMTFFTALCVPSRLVTARGSHCLRATTTIRNSSHLRKWHWKAWFLLLFFFFFDRYLFQDGFVSLVLTIVTLCKILMRFVFVWHKIAIFRKINVNRRVRFILSFRLHFTTGKNF